MLTTLNNVTDIDLADKLDDLEKEMLDMPQLEAPVQHLFGPGIYVREARFPAGSVVLGHRHRGDTLNTLVQGRMIVIGPEGEKKELSAPCTFVSPPGRKVAYIMEDVVFHNIFATEETDIDALEAMFFDKTEYSMACEQKKLSSLNLEHEADRQDFLEAIAEFDLTEDQVKAISFNVDDVIDMPRRVHPYRIAESPIHGQGYFLTMPARANTILAPANWAGMRTPAGRFVNHSCKPNARMAHAEDGNTYLVAVQDIQGCRGGDKGEEVTIDYRDALRLAISISQTGELCQE